MTLQVVIQQRFLRSWSSSNQPTKNGRRQGRRNPPFDRKIFLASFAVFVAVRSLLLSSFLIIVNLEREKENRERERTRETCSEKTGKILDCVQRRQFLERCPIRVCT